jgi:helicase
MVFDEAHILGNPVRGAAMESLIMRISCINPKCRFMLLSGTMGNAREIAVWLKSLNGKSTKVIKSSWRPFPVKVIYHEVSAYRSKISKAISIVEEIVSGGEKVIVFVHSKDTGKEICKILLKKKIRCAFHNSSCSVKNRKLIEDSFSASKFNVLISTSTLGAGVNLHD